MKNNKNSETGVNKKINKNCHIIEGLNSIEFYQALY